MYASKSESAQSLQAISNLCNKCFTEIGFNLASTTEIPTIIDNKLLPRISFRVVAIRFF